MASRWAAFRKAAPAPAPISIKEDGDLFSRAKHRFDTLEVGSDDDDDQSVAAPSEKMRHAEQTEPSSPSRNSDRHRSKRQKSSSADVGEHSFVSAPTPQKSPSRKPSLPSLPSPPKSEEKHSNPVLQDSPVKPILVAEEDDEEEAPTRVSPVTVEKHEAQELEKQSNPVQINIVEDTAQDEPPPALQSATKTKQASRHWEDPEDIIMRLAQEARARAKALHRTPSHNNGMTTTAKPSANTARSVSPRKTSQPPPDPIVEILITSQLPNTRPAILRYTLNAPLKEARRVWCAQYGLSEDISRDVILTFKKQKLFDYTTCKSLAIGPDADGITPFESVDPADPTKSSIKVHFEATTEQALSEWRKNRAAGLIDSNGDAIVHEADTQAAPPSAQEQPVQPAEEKEKPIRLILRAKGRPEVKIRARPSSTIARLKEGYREEAKVGPDAIVEFHFDGERLEEDMTLAEADLEDMASVDVYVR